MSAPRNPEKTEHFDHSDRNRIVDEREAAWRRGVSRDTLRRLTARTGRPRRIQLSERRFGYLLSEILDL
jgi:predicted DNA-binding transcriptional regulator AlpA